MPFQGGDDFRFVDGLRNVVVHTGGDAAIAIALHGVGGHGHDDVALSGCFTAANFGGCLIAVHHRHLTVHEDDVVSHILDHFDSFRAVGDEIDAATQTLEHAGGNDLIDGVVLDDQHARTNGIFRDEDGIASRSDRFGDGVPRDQGWANGSGL
jgi:hypothetical protein